MSGGMRGKMGKYRRWGVIAALVFLVLCITGVFLPMMFYLNDDVTIRSILSGAYTGIPDGHAVYMKYPLTGMISLLYRLAGYVPWYPLFMSGLFWLAASMTLGQLADVSQRLGVTGICLTICAALLCASLFLPHFVYMHYTVIAAMLGGCGLFLTALGGRKKAVLLFALCYCVRSQVFLLLLPFLAVMVLWQLWEKKWREQLVMLVLLAGCILICMMWNGLMYRSEQWQQFEAYNESRTQLYDYNDLLPYEEYREQYEDVGIGEWEYVIMEQYALAMDSVVDAKLMQAASDVYLAKRGAERSTRDYLRFCLTEYYYHAVYTDRPYNHILIGIYFLTVILLLQKRRWVQFLLTCCMAAGRSMIWVFLIWRGRFPERIYISLYLIETMVLAGMICAVLTGAQTADGATRGGKSFPEKEKEKHSPVIAICVCVILSLTLFAIGAIQMNAAAESAYSQKENQKKWNVLTAYCEEHDSNFYLLDVRSMVSYAGEIWENDTDMAGYLLAGGWMSGTPLLQERIDGLGAADGGELLVRGMSGDARILYIASPERNVDWLSGYLTQRFGAVQVERADSILLDGEEVFCVYSAMHQ